MALDQVTTGVIKDDAVTGAKVSNNLAIAGNLSIPDGGNFGSATDPDAISIAANGNVTLSQALTVTGDLTVNGTNTTVNATNLQIDDKQIELAHSPSGSEGDDAAVDGGGIILKSSDSDKEIKWVNADDAWTFNQHLFPAADNTSNLGSASKRWANIYTTDLHLNNDRGDWTIIEEEEYLSIQNNKNGKMYKFVLEEIE